MYNLALLLQDKSPRVGNTTFIAVDGHGGSGKSSLAQLLSEKLHAEIIHTDDSASWDNPTEWHTSLIEKVFLPIGLGATTLSYDRSKWWDNHHPEPIKNQLVTKIMILEGVRSLRKELREYISLGIFVDTPREVCLGRGVARDMQTGKTKNEVLKLWTDWLDGEDAYFTKDEPQKYADIVVDGIKPFDEQIQFALSENTPQVIKDDLGVKRGTVRLVPHNPNWKALFEEEKKLLLAKFPNTILKISHGGSTAIPNIPAKPIIDMFAVVSSLSEADAIKDDLEKLGYEYVGERGVPERRLAVKGPEERRTHHLQFVEEASKEWTNHILIREYYLKHPEVAEEYARLKQDLAQKYPEDRVSYTNGKEDFIASVIEKAKREERRENTPQIIKDVGFDFSWSEEKVWALDVPVEEMNISELTWHFDIPFLWENGIYNLTSREVIEHPDEHKAEYERTMRADLSYPIDIMENKGRWLILDGLHRLMKASILKRDTVQVRKIPPDRIPEIVK